MIYIHFKAGGTADIIVNPSRNTENCIPGLFCASKQSQTSREVDNLLAELSTSLEA